MLFFWKETLQFLTLPMQKFPRRFRKAKLYIGIKVFSWHPINSWETLPEGLLMSSEHFKDGTKEWVRGILMSTLKHILQLICSQQEMKIPTYLCISTERERKYKFAQGEIHLFLACPTSLIFLSLHKGNHSWRQGSPPEKSASVGGTECQGSK